MWKKIALAGATGAIIIGAGSAALAASGSTSASPSSPAAGSSSAAAAAGHGKHGKDADRLRRAVHATWVTEDKQTKTFTTHDAIKGLVTAVSPTSITVKAADNTTETYQVNASTKVHTRANRTAAAIADVKTGDPVLVAGTGTSTLTATQVIDAKK